MSVSMDDFADDLDVMAAPADAVIVDATPARPKRQRKYNIKPFDEEQAKRDDLAAAEKVKPTKKVKGFVVPDIPRKELRRYLSKHELWMTDDTLDDMSEDDASTAWDWMELAPESPGIEIYQRWIAKMPTFLRLSGELCNHQRGEDDSPVQYVLQVLKYTPAAVERSVKPVEAVVPVAATMDQSAIDRRYAESIRDAWSDLRQRKADLAVSEKELAVITKSVKEKSAAVLRAEKSLTSALDDFGTKQQRLPLEPMEGGVSLV